MSSAERRLVRHLAIAIVLKLAVLAALWWAFVRDDRVGVDAEAAAAHVDAGTPDAGVRAMTPTGVLQ